MPANKISVSGTHTSSIFFRRSSLCWPEQAHSSSTSYIETWGLPSGVIGRPPRWPSRVELARAKYTNKGAKMGRVSAQGGERTNVMKHVFMKCLLIFVYILDKYGQVPQEKSAPYSHERKRPATLIGSYTP